jgi:aminobenzoyl-glutamate utilization protein B
MNVGVNFLREHVTEKVRIHYAITRGGDVPNIVPDEAEVWYFVRALERKELDEVMERVTKCAEGAALMTETTVERRFRGACSCVLNNHYLADLQYAAMQFVGPIEWTEEERAYAQEVNDAYPPENIKDLFKHMRVPPAERERVAALDGEPLLGDNFPAWDEEHVSTGSTDVGDVSWIAPLSELHTACFATGAAGHSWGIVATGATSIGHKGMMHAAKVMALAAMDLYTEAEHLRASRSEFEEATRENPYVNPIPAGVAAPWYPNPERGID